jgi:hypothetical protein
MTRNGRLGISLYADCGDNLACPPAPLGFRHRDGQCVGEPRILDVHRVDDLTGFALNLNLPRLRRARPLSAVGPSAAERNCAAAIKLAHPLPHLGIDRGRWQTVGRRGGLPSRSRSRTRRHIFVPP